MNKLREQREADMRYSEQDKMETAMDTMSEVLTAADDIYKIEDAMPYLEGVAMATDISLDTLKSDPRIAELLQKKIDHNVKEEIIIWLEAKIEVGDETTPDRLKDAVRSRLIDLHVQEAVFSRVWDHLKQDLPVYYAKNLAAQFKNRNEGDGFIAEIENVFSSDSIWTIIDGLKENEVLFSLKFSSDDWQSVNSILELKMSEFLEKRQTAWKEIMNRLDEIKTKLNRLISFCQQFSTADARKYCGFYNELPYGFEKIFIDTENALKRLALTLNSVSDNKSIESDYNDIVKIIPRFVENISTLQSELLILSEQKNTFLEFVQKYQDAAGNPTFQRQIQSEVYDFIKSSTKYPFLNFFEPPSYDERFLNRTIDKIKIGQKALGAYQKKLKKLQDAVPHFDELIQQHESELEQQRVLDVKFKRSDNQRNGAVEDLTTLADVLRGTSEIISDRLISFAKNIISQSLRTL